MISRLNLHDFEFYLERESTENERFFDINWGSDDESTNKNFLKYWNKSLYNELNQLNEQIDFDSAVQKSAKIYCRKKGSKEVSLFMQYDDFKEYLQACRMFFANALHLNGNPDYEFISWDTNEELKQIAFEYLLNKFFNIKKYDAESDESFQSRLGFFMCRRVDFFISSSMSRLSEQAKKIISENDGDKQIAEKLKTHAIYALKKYSNIDYATRIAKLISSFDSKIGAGTYNHLAHYLNKHGHDKVRAEKLAKTAIAISPFETPTPSYPVTNIRLYNDFIK